MNKHLVKGTIGLVGTVLVAVVVLNITRSNNATPEIPQFPQYPPATPPTETPISIKPIDTSTWNRAQLHQNISVLIPNTWTAGSDGIYNYDYTKATGIRDPNFPDNSFKCVFYKDEALRSKINIEEEEKTINTQPKLTYIAATWNEDNSDSLRKLGEVVNLYTFKTETDEIFVECNIFKGVMLEVDRNILENSILTL